ncbi:hypothetical protein COMA1_50112 [Candidatus Nitrospira nitrosa]|uniref:Extracellular repeat protein, HAF family n=1 Tax=Candidatus Nitrospira nitrosa TaxID=1742972 RepID=A0A0S4LNZ9_9BACT|nr:DUF3466 family protein [Candidatus Nitrospira nitrosa]CUS38458.1 hypothetical protein COMA1_50112 [Candidatus Nitrospira nitrosa]
MKRFPCFSRWHDVILCSLLSLGIVIATERLVQAGQYSLTDLGSLGGGRSGATAINNSGEVVGWSTVPGNISHVFLYKSHMMMSLGITVGVYASAYGINDLEQIVGQTGDGYPFLYDHGTVRLLPGIAGNAGYGRAYAINASGVAVGYTQTSATSYAVMYHNGVLTNINVWGGPFSAAYDINDSGQVVGQAGLINFGPRHAFLYHNGVMTDLHTFSGRSSVALGINNSGQIVGQAMVKLSSVSEAGRAFLYTNGKMVDLLSPPGVTIDASSANGINKSGQIVGWYNKPGYGHFAFVYSNGVMHNLNTMLDASGTGWGLSEAIAINDLGQIICKAGSHTVLLTPVPVP